MIYAFEVEDTDYFSNKSYDFCLFSSAISPRSQKTLKEGLRSVLLINNVALGFPWRNARA